MSQEYKRIEYMCTFCGRLEARMPSMGRPMPGECPRRNKAANGRRGPHRWVLNRKY